MANTEQSSRNICVKNNNAKSTAKQNKGVTIKRYSLVKFNNSVKYYEEMFSKVKSNRFYLDIDMKDKNSKKAFFSIPAMSAAINNLNKDIFVNVFYSNSTLSEKLSDIWAAYENYSSNLRMNHKTASLIKLIRELNKQNTGFEKMFARPTLIECNDSGFVLVENGGDFKLSVLYKSNYINNYKISSVLNTTKNVIKSVFNLKRNETLKVALDLFPKFSELDRPKEDILDSFFIAYSALLIGNKTCSYTYLNSYSARYKLTDTPEITADLIMTILGLEHKKFVKEKIFEYYRTFSKEFKLADINVPDAVFGVFGKGVYGKHLFGDSFGYPTKNKKIRWTNPDKMFFKFPWSPESKFETKDPILRIGFTDTLPLDIYVNTCNIDWMKMHNKNQMITNILNKCEKVKVKGKGETDFTVYLSNCAKDKKKYFRRYANNSDIDVREKIDKEHFKKTGLRCGNMGNLPGGESFITPEYIEGKFVGDVVVHIDSNYMLSNKKPLVISMNKEGYTVVSGPKKILDKLEEKKKECWDKIILDEKTGTVSKDIINLKKKNFNGIGEFAINTNPKAKPCNYLIVNEKIANMMHIALGSGFDADKATDYHYDIVFDSKTQKLDVCGITKSGKEVWILKTGKFVI